MKILVDCATSKKGGARTYMQGFLNVLAESPDSHHWILYGPANVSREIPPLPDHVEFREFSWMGASSIAHLAWLIGIVPRIVRREGADVFFAATGFGMLEPVCPQMILVRNPIYFSRRYTEQIKDVRVKIEIFLRRRISLRMIRSSCAVLFPTRAMRDLVAEHLCLDRARVVIVPYGCDPQMFSRQVSDFWFPKVLDRARGKFLLNVSLYSAQKNFTVLFKALGILRRQGSVFPLVLTTRLAPQHSATFREDQETLQEGGTEGQVIQLGDVPRERLPALYRAARLFVFPSYVESFGHPLAEAMAAGLPILAADTPVNREVCGPAAVYVPPFSPEDWAVWIRKLVEDQQECQRLREAALLRASRFSWQTHVAAVVQAAQELTDGKNSSH